MKSDIIFFATTETETGAKQGEHARLLLRDTISCRVLLSSAVIQNDTVVLNGNWQALDMPFLNLGSNLNHRASDSDRQCDL